MGDPVTINLRHVARGLGIPLPQVQAVVELLDDGNTVPFITRYRKDQTGGLDEEQIRQIQARMTKMRLLAERKQTILRSIESQGKLTEKLAKQIHAAGTTKRLEDLYLPYKPKKQTLATIARERGLEPLANEILNADPSCADLDARAADFVNPDRQVPTPADALLGAGHILAERFSEQAELRQRLREILQRNGKFVSTRVGGEPRATPARSAEKTRQPTDRPPSSGRAAPPQAAKPQAPPTDTAQASKEPQSATGPTQGDGGGHPQQPVEAQPVEVQPVEGQPVEPQPVEVQPVEAQPVEVQPVEAQPVEPQPVEPQPADVTPQTDQPEPSRTGVEADAVPQPSAEAQPETPSPEADTPEQGSGQGGGEDLEEPAEPEPEAPLPADLKAEAEQPADPEPEAQQPAEPASETQPSADPEPEAQQPADPPGAVQGPVVPPAEVQPAVEAAVEAADAKESEQPPAPVEPAVPPGAKAGTKPPEAPPRRPRKPRQKPGSERRPNRKEQRKRKAEEKKQKAFSDYFDYGEEIKKIPPHRVLAINRGERAKVLRVKLDGDTEAMYRVLDEICVPAEHPHAEFLRGCARDSLTRLILPGLEREIRRELTDRAEAHAVGVFARNLRNLLLQPPVRGRRVLAVDPGYKSGCKLVALDQFGNMLAHGVIYLVGRPDRKQQARQIVTELIDRFQLSAVTIGNGTACREVEDFFAELTAEELKDKGVAYVIVNEAGASVYSTSRLGREEFPDYDATLRGAISIGRRLQDPLSELVKIDPANLGVGLYQHDVKAKHLRTSLDEVVESCVNYVGVDVNTASPALLRYVSGLNQLTARRVYEHRLQHGPFRNREQLKEVSGFGEATFVQAAGFLKITSGDNPLDVTWIHPESYQIAACVMAKLACTAAELAEKQAGGELAEPIRKLDVAELAKELEVGTLLLGDILAQLVRPGRDPREDLPAPVFKQGVLKLEDLSPGMELTGTVLNVVDFGAFVDIGMHDSGLVHVSQLADKFVRDPHDVIAVGDIVKVWVVEVDKERRRVSLTMIRPGARRSAGRREDRPERQARPERPARPGQPRPDKRPRGKGPPRFKGKGPSKPSYRPKRPPKPVVPITNEMKTGKKPMRSFSDLAQFFDVKKEDPPESKSKKRTQSTKRKAQAAKEENQGKKDDRPNAADAAQNATGTAQIATDQGQDTADEKPRTPNEVQDATGTAQIATDQGQDATDEKPSAPNEVQDATGAAQNATDQGQGTAEDKQTTPDEVQDATGEKQDGKDEG